MGNRYPVSLEDLGSKIEKKICILYIVDRRISLGLVNWCSLSETGEGHTKYELNLENMKWLQHVYKLKINLITQN